MTDQSQFGAQPPLGPRDPLAMLDRPLGLLAGLVLPLFLFGRGAGGAAFGLAGLMALCILVADPAVRTWLAARLKGGVCIVFLVTLGWWMLASLAGPDPLESASVVARLGGLVFLAAVLAGVLAHRPAARSAAEVGFTVGFTGLMTLAAASASRFPDLARFFVPGHEGWLDPAALFKSYTSVLALALPVAAWIGWRHGGVRAIALGGAAVAAGILFYGDGRQPGFSGILGLCGALAVLAILHLARGSASWGRVVVLGGSAAIVAVGFVAVLASLPPVPFDPDRHAAGGVPGLDLHRQVIWSFTMEKVAAAPLLGHGVNLLPFTEGAQDMVPGMVQSYLPGHPHNWVLEIAAETGLPGLLLLVTAQAIFAIYLFRAGFARRRGAALGLAVLAAFWASSLVNFSIWSAWWQVAFLTALLFPLAALEADRKPVQNRANGPV